MKINKNINTIIDKNYSIMFNVFNIGFTDSKYTELNKIQNQIINLLYKKYKNAQQKKGIDKKYKLLQNKFDELAIFLLLKGS